MFDLSEIEVSNDYDLIPQGYYPAFVDSAEWKVSNSNSDSKYVNVMWKITGDKHEGRVVWDMLQLLNVNDTAKNIALSTLKKMLEASGIGQMAFNTEEDVIDAILKCRCIIKVVTKKDEKYGDKNIIKGFKKMEEPVVSTISSDVPF